MTELVLAVFDAASAADAAVQDLKVARIPSAVIGARGPRQYPAPGDRGRGRDACWRRHGDLEPIWPARARRARCPKPPARDRPDRQSNVAWQAPQT